MTAREILGVELNATDEQIRAAYLTKITEHPPDRSPPSSSAFVTPTILFAIRGGA